MHIIQADHPEQTNHLTTPTTLTTLNNIFTRNCIVCNNLSFTIDKFRIRFDSWGLLFLVYKAIITYMLLSPSQGANLALLNAVFSRKVCCFGIEQATVESKNIFDLEQILFRSISRIALSYQVLGLVL